MTPEDQLLEIARRQRIGVFFDARARRDGLPWIVFMKNGIGLAEFYDLPDALAWFPTSQNHEPGAAGTLIHQSATF